MSDLDEKEQNNVRATLRYLRCQIGTWVAVSAALRLTPETIERAARGRNIVTASLAFRVARLLGASVDDLLAGRYRPGACPKCGHLPSYLPASDFADESTVVEAAPRPMAGSGLALVK